MSNALPGVEDRSAMRRESKEARSSPIVSVESYCADVRARIQKREPDFVLGLPGEAKEQWQRYASRPALDKASDEIMINQMAYVWTEGGKVIAANFTLQSESRDWALYPNYCFHANETVAELSSELRTFYGHMIVRRDWQFDPHGRLIRSSEEFLDLDTKKPKKPDKAFMDEDSPLYHKVSDLPFYPLLRKSDRRPLRRLMS